MKKTFKIKPKNLASRPPLMSTVVMLIALDHWGASDVTRGIFYALFAIIWILTIVDICVSTTVDIFEIDKDDPNDFPFTEAKGKSKFQEKLEKLAKERGYKVKDN